MSLLSPIECGTEYSFLNILKKVVKKDEDGNYYIGTTGLASDKVAPFPVNAEVGNIANGIIYFTFSEPLDETSVPAAGDFVINGMTDPSLVDFVTINASWMRIFLLTDVYYGDVPTVSYTPGANPIRDLAGNLCDPFINFPITNNCGFCPQYQLVWDAYTTKPNNAQATIWNMFVCRMVESLEWDLLDVLWVYAAHINTAGEALKNWKNPGTFDATAFNAPAFTADQGILFNGTTQYTNSGGWIPSVNGFNYTQNSASMIIYIRTNVATTTYHGTRGNANTKDCSLVPQNAGGVAVIRTNDGTNSSSAFMGIGSGLYINTRTAAAVNKLYRNSTPIINGITASTGVPAHSPYAGAINDDNLAAFFRADQVSMVAYGGGFSQADVTAITDIFEAAMDALGTGVIP